MTGKGYEKILLTLFIFLSALILSITHKGLWGSEYLDRYIFNSYLGSFQWLIFPTLLIFLFTCKKRKRWEIALAALYIISMALLIIEGSDNYRYALTLLPFTITAAVSIGWQSVEKTPRFVKIGMYLCLVVFITLNVGKHLSDFQRINKHILNSKNDDIPWNIFQFINNLDVKQDNNILVCNAPAFYYYTAKHGIVYMGYYKSHGGGVGIITEHGIADIFRIAGKDEISISSGFSQLQNRYHIKYIFTRAIPENYIALSILIKDGSELLLRDESYSLYKLKRKYLEDLTPPMTSNTTPAPYQVIYSSRRDSSDWDAFRAFDNVADGHYGWHTPIGSRNEYIGFDFALENNTSINGYSLVSNDTNPSFMPRDWIFEASNDKRSWVALQTVKNQTNWAPNERRDFKVSKNTAYRYYRINIKSGNGDYLLIGEFKLWFDKP